MKESEYPHFLRSDGDGHYFLIPEFELKNFQKWMIACENGDYEDGMYYCYLNDYSIDLPRLKIYKWETN